MLHRILVACLLALAAPAAALADAADDCNRFDRPTIQLKGCTKFIRSGTLDPAELSMAYTNRGVANAALGKLDKAIGDFSEAVKLSPGNALALYNRGNVQFDRKEMRLAIADYDLALAQDPEFTLAYYNRGIAYENLGERERCIADYRKALTLEPTLDAARERLQKLGVQPEEDKTSGASPKPTTGT